VEPITLSRGGGAYMIGKILHTVFIKPNEAYDSTNDAFETFIFILVMLVAVIIGIYIGFRAVVLYMAGIALYRIQFWMYKLGKMPRRGKGEEGGDP
jgi:hypothetical protein